MAMPTRTLIVGNDGANVLQGGASAELIYGFDPNGPQGNTSAIAATRVAAGLAEPVFATAPPGDVRRLFIVEKGGRIQILDLATGAMLAAPFLDITSEVNPFGEQGLLGLAFHPDYATNGLFYVYLSTPSGDAEVRRYQVSAGDPNRADAATAQTERTGQISPDAGQINNPSSFGEDGRGNLYLVDFDGDIFRLTPQVASTDQGDDLSGGGGDDMVFAGSGADRVFGEAGRDALDGGLGDDLLDGGEGPDQIFGGAGADTVSYLEAPRAVLINLFGKAAADGIDTDTLSSIENAVGSAFNDTIIGDAGANVLDGGREGSDQIFGGGDLDTVSYAASPRAVSSTSPARSRPTASTPTRCPRSRTPSARPSTTRSSATPGRTSSTAGWRRRPRHGLLRGVAAGRPHQPPRPGHGRRHQHRHPVVDRERHRLGL